MFYQSLQGFISRHFSTEQRRRIAQVVPEGLVDWWVGIGADVYLISFPKCGRTWLRLMIGRGLQQHFCLDAANPMELHQLAALHEDIPEIRVTHDDDPQWKKADELSESKGKYRHKKVILLVRDPRDVIVSSYFQKSRRQEVFNGTLPEYIYSPVGSLETLIRFLNIWAANRHVPRGFLLVRYEDLHMDPRGELRKTFDFLDLQDIAEETIAEAVEFASFDNMRRMEEEDVFRSKVLRPRNKKDVSSYKTREGKVGGFANHMAAKEAEYVSRRLKEALAKYYGYD